VGCTPEDYRRRHRGAVGGVQSIEVGAMPKPSLFV
jgi:hypothetical protein